MIDAAVPCRPFRLEIAPADPDQVAALMAIDALSQPAPWSRQMFLDEIARPWAHIDVARVHDSAPGAGCVAGDVDGYVAGYIDYWLVEDEVQLHNLAVHPDSRRRGLGTALMQHLVAFARAHACALITLEVRAGNTGARALYQQHGFTAVGLRKGYYARENEDAVVMHLALPREGGR